MSKTTNATLVVRKLSTLSSRKFRTLVSKRWLSRYVGLPNTLVKLIPMKGGPVDLVPCWAIASLSRRPRFSGGESPTLRLRNTSRLNMHMPVVHVVLRATFALMAGELLATGASYLSLAVSTLSISSSSCRGHFEVAYTVVQLRLGRH